MRRLAVIPARAGSKRLPGKNTLPFRGAPLIEYSLWAAIDSGLFDRILVTTDDAEARAAAERCGVEAWERPEHLRGDTATVNQTLHDVLDRCDAMAERFDQLCCLYATAPLRTAKDVAAAHALLAQGECDFVIGVTGYPFSPYQALKRNDSGGLELIWPEVGSMQSQRLPRPLVDNGSTYWADVAAYRKTGSFYGLTLRGYEMPFERSIDIDTQEDFRLAERLAAEGEAK